MGDLAIGLSVILVGLAVIMSALTIHLVCRQPQKDEYASLVRASMRDRSPVARRHRMADRFSGR